MNQLQHRPRPFAVLAALGLAWGLSSSAWAQSTAGAISLTFLPSVRGEAMGGLSLSAADDYAARWSNPGGLAFIDRTTVGLMGSQLVPGLANDVYFMYGSVIRPTTGIGTLQLDVTYLSYGESQAVSEDQQTLGTFKSYEFSPALSLGFKFLPNVGLGVAVKWIRIDLAPEEFLRDNPGSGSGSAHSWAFDMGALYKSGPLRFGGVISNLGPDITFIDSEQSDPMPRTVRLGGMYDVLETDIAQARFGVEYEQSIVSSRPAATTENPDPKSSLPRPLYHMGAEFVYLNVFALRAGYLHDQEGDVKGVSGGFGFRWSDATLEYASVPQASDLDRVHKFALWMRI